MAKQTLSIGDTGAQLVSKFNNNLNQPYGKYYNVEDYGAVHDGLTDDTTAIQDAINACCTAGGGTVYFPNGIYLLSGALQTNIGGINYDSQLYIPALGWDSSSRYTIKLLGEEVPNDTMNNQFEGTTNLQSGVIWKSTITGTNMFSSVICSKGPYSSFGDINYNNCHIENITIYVKHDEEDGACLSGINFVNSSLSHLRNIWVTTTAHYLDTVQPTTKYFGVSIGKLNSNISMYVDNVTVCNMYYGFVIGEGVYSVDMVASGCYIGVMFQTAAHPSHLFSSAVHWCKYHFASQQGVFIGAAGAAKVLIEGLSMETKPDGNYWFSFTDFILDTDNYLYGEMMYHYLISGDPTALYLTKSNGGCNLLCKSLSKASNFHWTTGTRPPNPGYGCTGWNATTNKLECFNGSTWSDLF